MKAFNLLPSSPSIREMNKAQLLFCYQNIVKDEEEQEELWKERMKFLAMFINPEMVLKFENGINNTVNSNSITHKDQQNVYVNDSFEEELKKAMSNNEFFEMPNEDDTRGDANMSSEDFLDMCEQMMLEDDLKEDLKEDVDIIVVD